MLGEFLGVFVNTLTAGGKYPAGDSGNLLLLMQVQLSEKQKKFSENFWNLHQKLNIFKEKIAS